MDRGDAIDWYVIARGAQSANAKLRAEIAGLANRLSWNKETREIAEVLFKIIEDH